MNLTFEILLGGQKPHCRHACAQKGMNIFPPQIQPLKAAELGSEYRVNDSDNNDSNNNATWWSWIYKGASKGVSNIWGYASSYFKPSAKQIKEAGEPGASNTIAQEQTPPAQELKNTPSLLGNVVGVIYSAAGSVGAGTVYQRRNWI